MSQSEKKKPRAHIHTYDPPHGLHQPAKGVSWNVSGKILRSITMSRRFNLKYKHHSVENVNTFRKYEM